MKKRVLSLVTVLALLLTQLVVLPVFATDTNVAVGKSVYANSANVRQTSSVLGLKEVTDGIRTTAQGSGNANGFSINKSGDYYYVDLGSIYDIDKTDLAYTASTTNKYTLYYSNDAVNWTLLVDHTAGVAMTEPGGAGTAYISEDTFSPIQARFIKYVARDATWRFITEFEVYSPNNTPYANTSDVNYCAGLTNSPTTRWTIANRTAGAFSLLGDGIKDSWGTVITTSSTAVANVITNTFTVDLTAVANQTDSISRASLYDGYPDWGSSGQPTYLTFNMKVDVSTDGTTYTNVYDDSPTGTNAPAALTDRFYAKSSSGGDSDGFVYRAAFTPVNARYIRVTSLCTVPTTGSGASLKPTFAELEVDKSLAIPVTGVTIAPTTASITAGNNTTLTATVSPNGAVPQNISWSSTNPAVASVPTTNNSLTCQVTGVSAGTANITCTVDGHTSNVCAVTVQSAQIPVTGVNIKNALTDPLTTDNLFVQGTDNLTAEITPSNATYSSVTWATDNSNAVSVTPNNLNCTITANAPGTANITVTVVDANGPHTATCHVVVSPILVTSISLSTYTDTVNVGATDTLASIASPTNATNQTVTWLSDNTAVATVSTTGVVTGVSTGTANITATSTDGSNKVSTPCVVTIVNDLAFNKPVYTNFKNNGGQGLTKVTNGILESGESTDNGFYANTPGQWVVVDLGQQYDISETDLFYGGSGSEAYKLEGSLDGVNFTTMVDQSTSRSIPSNNTFTDYYSTPARVRFIRYTKENSAWNTLVEIKAYSQTSAVPSTQQVNLAAGKTALFNGVGTNQAAMTDGNKGANATTFWSQVPNGSSFWTINLGSVQNISSTLLYLQYASAMGAKVEVSTNGTTYHTVYDSTSPPANITTFGYLDGSDNVTPATTYGYYDTTNTWGFVYPISFTPVSAQYVRVTASGKYIGYNEIEVYNALTIIPVTNITVTPGSANLYTGDTSALTAVISPSNATVQTLNWSSSNPSVATVNSSGVVTAVGAGTAYITASSMDGSNITSNPCVVTVSQRVFVTGVSLNTHSITSSIGGTNTLIATFNPSNASDTALIWSTSNANVATVNSNGLVTAVANGSATITVTTHDGGFTDTCTGTVNDAVVINVINLINALPNPAKIKDKAQVDAANTAYNALTSAQQTSITSYYAQLTTAEAQVHGPNDVNFGDYIITNNFITNVAVGLSQSDFLSGLLVNNGTAQLLDANGNPIAQGVTMATGMQFVVTVGQTITTYTIVIYGDIDGDGQITSSDLALENQILLETQSFAVGSAYYMAADINKDGTVSIADLLSVKKYLVGLETISQC